MINEDNKFQDCANAMVKDIATNDLLYLVALFMKEASINMGVEVNNQIIESVIYYIKKDYGYVPLNFIASGFVRGSLGKIGDGKGRLVPKTIFAWLSDSSLEYNRMIASIREKEKLNDVSIAMDLHKYPIGSAIAKKIEWYRLGALNINDWDKVPLKQVAQMIGEGHRPTLEYFGIKNHLK
jgi:hypothetical protein